LILAELNWMNIKEMREKQKAIMMYKIVNGLAPEYLTEMFTFHSSLNYYSLRQSKLNFELPVNRTDSQACLLKHAKLAFLACC
jgi:hypothetical protein